MNRITILVDYGRIQRLRATLAGRQRFPLAVVLGLITAGFYVFVWGLFAGLSGLRGDFLPFIGGGFAIGTVVRLAGRGIDREFKLLAAALALLTSFGGDVVASGYLLAPQTGFTPRSSSLITGFYLGSVSGWSLFFYALSAIEAWWLAGVRVSRFRLTAVAPRGGQRGVDVDGIGSSGLCCEKGHRAHPLYGQLKEDMGVACCPRCGEPMYARVPASRIRAERSYDKLVFRGTLGASLAAPVLLFGGIYLGVSRWKVDDIQPVGSLVVFSDLSFDQGARAHVYDLEQDALVFSRGGRDKLFELSHQGRTIKGALPTSDGLLLGTPNLDFEDDDPEASYLLLTRVPLDALDTEPERVGILMGSHYDLFQSGELLFTRNRKGIHAFGWPHLETVSTLAQEDVSARAFGFQDDLATVTRHGELCRWDLEEDQLTKCIGAHIGAISDVHAHGSGWVTSGVWDHHVSLWDAELAPRHTLTTDLDWQTSIAMHPHGTQLAIGGGSISRRGEVQLWDLETRSKVQAMQVSEDTVVDVAFSDDGRTLFAGSAPPMTVLSSRRRGALYALDLASGEVKVLHE